VTSTNTTPTPAGGNDPAPALPLPPGVERRRQLRRERRADRLRQLWRLMIYSLMAAGLGYGLLRQGWVLRDPTQVQVSGSALVNREQVIAAADLRFPQPLLLLDPRRLDSTLADNLPVESVQVSRRILPPQLMVRLVDRRPVALAWRRGDGGLEQGYVDDRGHWLSSRQQQALSGKLPGGLVVRGWHERHRAQLAQVLAQRQQLGPGLREIRFDPDGSLWLRTDRLGEVRLGQADDHLAQRLAVMRHLSANLPNRLRGRPVQLIDLSDPANPELSLPGTAPQRSGAVMPAPGTAPVSAPPPGGQ